MVGNNKSSPKKETILVCDRGDKNLKKPEKFKKIWSNIDFDEKLDIDPEVIPNVFTIWRPTAPKGYVSLGDYVSNGIQTPQLDSIRCVKEDLVESFNVADENVWNGMVSN